MDTYFGKVCSKHPWYSGERRRDNRGCLGCCRDQSKKWRAENKDKVKEHVEKYLKPWLEKNKDYVRESTRIRMKKWRKYNAESVKKVANSPKMKAYRSARRALTKKASPDWRNDFFIEEIYELAAMRTKMLGFDWHVDHIVPLKSKAVCGLHCEQNMQVIPAVDNVSKGNRHWPQM